MKMNDVTSEYDKIVSKHDVICFFFANYSFSKFFLSVFTTAFSTDDAALPEWRCDFNNSYQTDGHNNDYANKH